MLCLSGAEPFLFCRRSQEAHAAVEEHCEALNEELAASVKATALEKQKVKILRQKHERLAAMYTDVTSGGIGLDDASRPAIAA